MRTIVNVSVGRRWTQSYVHGQERLRAELGKFANDWDTLRFYTNGYPIGCPRHQDVPFAFKAYALKEAAQSASLLLWCDACIVPVQSLQEIWRRAQTFGVWLGKNGWKNSDWTALEAYPALFPDLELAEAQQINSQIEHVVATAFAIDTNHTVGRLFLQEYFRLASQTRAFCGETKDPRTKGPVPGITHRHDQTAASVIAWKLGIPLTEPPEYFAYKGGETDRTILVADGAY